MKDLYKIIAPLSIIFVLNSCNKDECQNCYKTIGGVAGTDTVEIKEVCDEDDAENLEASSHGTIIWDCENE